MDSTDHMVRGMAGGRVLVAWERFGPYHHARLQAAASTLPLLGLEITTRDRTYAWASIDRSAAFEHRVLLPDQDAGAPAHAYRQALERTLGEERFAAVAVPGWSDRAALALLVWARRRGVPAILMADSTAADAPRTFLKERVKRSLLRHYATALVAGAPHAAYLEDLGFPRERIFQGYDVVDNAHFASWRWQPQAAQEEDRRRLGLPARYFLASSRFVSKKNLPRLIEAYAAYRRLAGEAAWSLVLLGDGELRPQLEADRRRLGLEAHLLLPGFKQYDELPAHYGLASALVHAATSEQWGLVVNEAMAAGLPVLVSRACGCVPDLVRDGENGFAFAPEDTEGLARCLHELAHGTLDLAAMGRASRRIIAAWDLERFVSSLAAAVDAARRGPAARGGVLDRTLLWGLAHR